MKFRILAIAALLTTSLLFINCAKQNPDNETNGKELITTISGNVKNELNEIVPNATISIDGQTIVTDNNGEYQLKNVTIKQRGVITVKKDGYFDNYRTIEITKGNHHYVPLFIFQKSFSQSFNTNNGGNIVLSNKVSIDFEKNSIVDLNGNDFSGSVTVAVTYQDPAKALNFMPGGNLGVDANGKETVIKSFGMAGVELLKSNGEKLQLKKGTKATLKVAIPSSAVSKAPSKVALSYFDASTGFWKEEGSATKDGSFYIGSVSHFSFWNCVLQFEAVNIFGIIKDKLGIPTLSNIFITESNDSTSIAYGTTNEDGTFEGKIPKNMALNMIISHINTCEMKLFGLPIGPYTQDNDFGVITTNIETKKLNISGIVKDCNNTIIKGAVVRLILGSSIYQYEKETTTDDNGSYNFDMFNCNNLIYKVVAIDNIKNKVSSITLITEKFGIITKDLNACSSIDYVEISGTLQNSNGQLLDSTIVITNLNDKIPIQYTKSINGVFKVNGPKNTPLKLRLYKSSNCGEIEFSKEIGPFSQNTNIGNITVTYPSSTLNVSGILTDCNGNAVSNGVVHYAYDQYSKNYRFTDNNGAYSINIDNCNNKSYSFKAFDETNDKLSNEVTKSGVGNYTVNFSVCNQPDEYIRIQSNNPIFDNKIFQNISISDSLNNILIYSSETSTVNNVEFSMKGLINNNTGSAVKLSYLGSNINFGLGGNVTTNTITLQNFPVGVGEYYIGTFSIKGLTNFSGNNLVDITGDFKIKKK